MIWTMEGERYRVDVLPDPLYWELVALEETIPLDTKYPVFHNRMFMVRGTQNSLERVWLANPDKPNLYYLTWNGVNLLEQTENDMPFQPVLIPLDENDRDISSEMEHAFQPGEIIEHGYLFKWDKLSKIPYQSFNAGLHIKDCLPEGCTFQPKLRWIFYKGLFIAERQMAIIKTSQLWEYILRKEKT